MPPNNDLPFALVLLVGLALLGCGSLLLTRLHRSDLRFQMQLFLIALLARFAMSVIIYDFGLLQVLGDEDGSGWVAGVSLAKKWDERQVGLLDLPAVMAEALLQQHRGYAYLLGGLFYLTNAPARLPAAALNCFFGALTVVFTYRIAQTLFSHWVAVRVGWLTCFFPSMIVWSAQTLKEPVVIFLETVALYGCVHLKLKGVSLRYILLCGVAVILLMPFRFYATYIVATAAALALLLPEFSRRRFSVVSGLAVVALVGGLLISTGILARNEAQLENFDLRTVQTLRSAFARGTGSGVETNYDMQTMSGWLMGTAVGLAHLALAPFPWQLGGASLRMLLTLPELMFWWYLFFAGVLPGLFYAIRRRFDDMQPLLLFIAGLGLLYSMLFGNVGLIFRQRAQLLPWLFIFAVVGIEQRVSKRRLRQQAEMEQALLMGDKHEGLGWRV